MRRHSKFVNVCLALLCVVLVVILGSLIVWNKNQTKEDRQRLEKLADETRAKDEKALEESDKKQDKTEKALQKKAAQEKENAVASEKENAVTPTPVLSPKPSEPAKEKVAGISYWGDDLLTADDTQQYSYMAVLQKLLQDNGYDIPVLNKTLQGGGTLSMMKRAGVSDQIIQNFISEHQKAANGAQLYVTETGIRDFTEEELVRDDLDCIPVIFMGYYGGWNHDPAELAQQQEHILKTFSNQDRFIVVGTRPLDGSVDAATLDAVLSEKWKEHYISLAAVTSAPASTYEAQAAMAQAIYQKMLELKYISKK